MEDDGPSSDVPSRSSMSSTYSSSSSCNSAPVLHGGSVQHHHPPRRSTAPNNDSDQNVRVVARIRPLSSKEICENSAESIVAHPMIATVRVSASSTSDAASKKFEFDSVLGPSSTQEEVYRQTCADMIPSSVFKGFNATM